jgi:hypothetical protein
MPFGIPRRRLAPDEITAARLLARQRMAIGTNPALQRARDEMASMRLNQPQASSDVVGAATAAPRAPAAPQEMRAVNQQAGNPRQGQAYSTARTAQGLFHVYGPGQAIRVGGAPQRPINAGQALAEALLRERTRRRSA